MVDLPDIKKINELKAKKDAMFTTAMRSKTVALKDAEDKL